LQLKEKKDHSQEKVHATPRMVKRGGRRRKPRKVEKGFELECDVRLQARGALEKAHGSELPGTNGRTSGNQLTVGSLKSTELMRNCSHKKRGQIPASFGTHAEGRDSLERK